MVLVVDVMHSGLDGFKMLKMNVCRWGAAWVAQHGHVLTLGAFVHMVHSRFELCSRSSSKYLRHSHVGQELTRH